MTRNTRHLKPAPAVRITAVDAKRLLGEFDTFKRSCKVQKLGLHLVVDALVKEGARSTMVHRIVTSPTGPYKAAVGISPIQGHVLRRCACYAAEAAPRKK